MNFNYITLGLELLNFVVLMWLMKIFLYKPVLKVINDRRLSIDEKVNAAQSDLSEALDLKDRYEARLVDWEKEKEHLLAEVKVEMKKEREIELENLAKELADEREKQQAFLDTKRKMEEEKYEKYAHDLASGFIGKVFERLASSKLEELVFQMFIEDIESLDAERRERFLSVAGDSDESVEVTSAFPLGEKLRLRLEEAVNKAFEKHFTFLYEEEPGLIAGIKLNRRGNVLSCNLKDAEVFFTDMGTSTNGR